MSRASFGSTTVSQQLTRSTDMEDTFVDSSILSTDSAPASSNDGERASNLGPLSGSGFRRPADDNNDDEDDDDDQNGTVNNNAFDEPGIHELYRSLILLARNRFSSILSLDTNQANNLFSKVLILIQQETVLQQHETQCDKQQRLHYHEVIQQQKHQNQNEVPVLQPQHVLLCNILDWFNQEATPDVLQQIVTSDHYAAFALHTTLKLLEQTKVSSSSLSSPTETLNSTAILYSLPSELVLLLRVLIHSLLQTLQDIVVVGNSNSNSNNNNNNNNIFNHHGHNNDNGANNNSNNNSNSNSIIDNSIIDIASAIASPPTSLREWLANTLELHQYNIDHKLLTKRIEQYGLQLVRARTYLLCFVCRALSYR